MSKKKKAKKKPIAKKRKKDNSLVIQVKFTLLFAGLVFYLLAIFSDKTGLLGEWVRQMTLGVFGFSGYLLPFVFFFLFTLRISPGMKDNRARFSAGIVTFFIMSTFIQGYLLMGKILKIFSDNISTLKLSYESGYLGQSAGVFGNLLVVLSYKAGGSYGILILAVLLGLLSFYFFTRFSVADFQKNVVKATADFQENRMASKALRPEKPKNESFLFGTTRSPERLDESPDSGALPEFNLSDDYLHVNPREEEPKIFIPQDENPEALEIGKAVKESAAIVPETLAIELDEKVKKKTPPYREPPFSLLHAGIKNAAPGALQKKQMVELARKLEDILNTFSVKAQVLEVVKGPIVNRFEIQLEPGTKISKITGLADDLALNMAVPQVRVAPIPGKSTIGIEIPNKEKDSVALQEILRSKEYKNVSSDLAVALGKDISGKPVVADLAQMPHLLIAGSTGSGKSVCINTIIASLLFNVTPDEVKLLMIDPKVVELSNYNGIPHLILPVVTEPKKAALALGWAVNEMTRRYEVFAQAKVKDIQSYNKKIITEKMPRIVVIIDELADLMMIAPVQVEDSIARLSQMARAAGIHLIVATQRPSAEVITGQIKTNIPSRISFAVSSAIDSRIILDMSGAEKLLGKGDMLYSPFGSNRPRRVQGCFVSDEEIAAIVDYIKNQDIQTQYKEDIVEKAPQNFETEYDDEYLEDAIRLVIEMKSASASMLQRRFRIGYNRAGRLIDMMSDMGIVGPPQASKPRDVLLSDFEDVEPWK